MMRVSDSDLDRYLAEDVDGLDLTTFVLGIGQRQGTMRYHTREDAVLCGTEEAARIMERLGLEVQTMVPSGTRIAAGTEFLRASGAADALHAAWKVCLNLVDRCSGIATVTARIVEAARAVNPQVSVLTTRKIMPGTKPLATKAILAGGAFPHRLGLSETILIFEQHMAFYGGIDALIPDIPRIRASAVEKKIIVESSAADAVRLAEAGVDGLQFDKIPPAELSDVVEQVRRVAPSVTLLAAGGITPDAAADYAACGVDGLVTSFPYQARPIDMGVTMQKV